MTNSPFALKALHPACAMLIACAAAGAAEYPAKSIRVIVPFPPDSGVDIVARITAPALSATLDKPLVIDNRAGADGVVGAHIAVKAAPDGYTLLMATGGILCVLPLMQSNLPYVPARDFASIAQLAATPNILVTAVSLTARSVKELIALAREKPGAINYASTGKGTGSHLAAELFRVQTGITLVNVPYQGSAAALSYVIAGRVEIFFNNALSALPHVRNGKLHALGVISPERLSIAADIPTIAEAGVPAYAAETWYGLVAPTGTPRAIILRLNNALVRIFQHPDIGARLAADGARVTAGAPRQFADHLATENTKWGTVLKASALSVN